MRRTTGGAIAVLAAAVLLTTALAERTPAQAKKLVYWTHWEQNPEFNRWYETKGKEFARRSEEHTSELQSLAYLVCRLLLEKKKRPDTAFRVDTTILPL